MARVNPRVRVRANPRLRVRVNPLCDPQMYYLPQAEGVLLRAFDDRSRARG